MKPQPLAEGREALEVVEFHGAPAGSLGRGVAIVMGFPPEENSPCNAQTQQKTQLTPLEEP